MSKYLTSRTTYRRSAGRTVSSSRLILFQTVHITSCYPQRRDPRTGKSYYSHRAVAEWHLDRPLEPGEVVHHCDGNREDDHPENLWVLPGQSADMGLHWYLRREARAVLHLFDLEEWLELRG